MRIERPDMSAEEQIEKWVAGNPTHNPRLIIGGQMVSGGECCPDFSCCQPHLLAPEEERIFFRDNPDKRSGMLVEFLARMLRDEGHDVQHGRKGR